MPNKPHRITDEEWELIQGIREAGKEHGLSLRDLDHGWLKSKTSSVHFRNPLYEGPGQTEKEVDFDAIIKKYLESPPLQISPAPRVQGYFFDRLVYTDVHIGMTPNENGYSLYGGKWDRDEILSRLDIMIGHVLKNQKSDILLVDDLGDFMDGWDGETVRKGHRLPQNMDNEGAYDLGFEFKVRLADGLAPHFKKVVFHNICNDNHSGAFGYVVNSGFKSMAAIRYPNCEVVNVRKFIDHYYFGSHCFILTHGKDGKNLKFGFKPTLDPKQGEKIQNYINEHGIYRPGIQIEFSKGDSHQKILDEATSDVFDYYNYPAFSPSSEWVQTNFKKGKSGFEFFNYTEDGQKKHHPCRFDWITGREEESIDFSAFN